MNNALKQKNWLSGVYVSIVYPLTEPKSCRGLGARLRRYRQLEGLSLDANRELQWRALMRLLQHAYDTSPFYRRRLDGAGLRPSEISSPTDLRQIPVLTRDDIRDRLPELSSRQYRQDELVSAATGGTTDTPVPILRSLDSVREKFALLWQFNRWAGFRPGDKVLYLWGARQDFSENPSWRWRLYDRFLMRRFWAPTSLFNEKVLESYRQTLNRFRPRIIYAYPTPLTLFCEFLLSCGRPHHRPISAICTAEPLLASQRQFIERALGCPVFERYGSREFGMIAAECEHHCGLHLNPAAAYIEYMPMQGSDVKGLHEILVTDLLNYGMPLIRYRVNDCVVPRESGCPCGRGLPLLGRIEGRTTDTFRLATGDVVPGVALTNRVLKVCPGLQKVQVIQDTTADFRIRYVAGVGFEATDLDHLRSNLRNFFPADVRWAFERVPDIEREPSGKTRFCISHVPRPASDGALGIGCEHPN